MIMEIGDQRDCRIRNINHLLYSLRSKKTQIKKLNIKIIFFILASCLFSLGVVPLEKKLMGTSIIQLER